MRKKSILLLFSLLLIFSESYSRKFYFSSTSGSDTYSVSQAQNATTPWKTLVNLHRFANGSTPFGAYPNRAAAGDTFLFKCGDVFDTGWGNTNDDFGVVKWWNGVAGYTAPSGTANAPIVFASYGSGNKPNFLFPNPTAVVARNRYVMNFKNVGYLYFNNLQFNDTRFPVNDKISSAFTCSGMMVGESNASICNNIKVTNCNFSNTCYGIVSCARIFEISNNTFTNFKSCGDTIGTYDIGADALQPSGYKYLIKNNLIQGSWAYANPNSSSQGKLGGGLETINDFDSSLVIYNTFFDNSGAMEFGQNDGVQFGPNDDTFAYNIFINNSAISYVNVTGTFACTAARLHFWNNVIIENNNSRHTGPNFGKDVLGDGQSFTNWSNWPSFPLNPSNPANFPSSYKLFGYANDASVVADTLYDIRNNIIWNSNGLTQLKYPNTRTKIKYNNNLYRLSGGSSLGGVPLGTGEISTNSKIFIDTTSINPMNWNLLLMAASPAINMGTNVGFTRDYYGNQIIENPEAGIHEIQNASLTPLAINVVTGSIPCHGETTTATVSASGGTPPYFGTGVFTVSSGTRTFTINDATNTSKSSTITLTQPSSIVATVTAGRIITFGGSTTITVTASGGTGAYTYKLNNGNYQTSNIFNNVTAGIDTIFVKDANGCFATSTITISQPSAPLSATASAASNNLCNGATTVVNVTATGGTPPYTGTGSYNVGAGTYTYTILDSNGVSTTARITISQYAAITATVSAGTITIYGGKTTLTISNTSSGLSPYTYSLNGGVFQSSTSFTNVGAGNHNITIKDARGCSIVKTVSITQPASTLSCTSSATGTILCNGNNTVTVTVRATGGTTPYTGTGTFTVTGGTYTYTVTDAAGAVKTTTISISQPTAIVPTITAGRIIVFGGTTSITVTATGGTGAYTYKLNRGNYQTSNIFTGIPASRDTIYVKDANGCIVSGIINITQPAAALAATATIATPIACNGGTAVVNVAATGGTAPYTGTGTFNVLAGTYNYTIADSNGVSITTSVVVTQPAILAATTTAGTISVYGAKTTITNTTTGGTTPYTYSLNNGTYQTANIFSNVGAGTHNVIIKDAKGCTITKTVNITQPASTLNCTSTASGAILCHGNAVTVAVAATGGTPPYTGTGNFNVPAGNYTYTVTDAVGSVKTTSISITQPTAIVSTITAGRIITFGGTTTITVTATGGTGVYTYKRNRGIYQTSNVFTNVVAGTDTLYVKDANGCIATGIITITQPSAALAAVVTNTSGTVCNGANAVVTVRATGGTPPYTGAGTFSVPAGTYTYTVTDSNGVRSSSSITIAQYAAITATVSSGTISVYGAKTTVTVSNVSGGQTPYTYSINGGTYQTGTTFSNIGAGTHTVNILDGRGCSLTKTITITQPASTLNISAVPAGNIACFGGTISVSVSATGGTSPYTGTGNFMVSAGSYTYTVTDAVGSVRTTSINITQPTALVSSITSGRILINGGSTSITAVASGGTGAYSYKLNNGAYQTSNIFSGIQAGVDTIFVKDANNCISSGIVTINQPSPLVATYTNTPIYCNGGSSNVVINATGGIPPYTGIGTFNQSAGTVTYTIRDSAGATKLLPITLTQPAVLSQPVLTQGAAITVYGGTTTITVSGMTGGTLPYTYAVDNGNYQTSSILSTNGGDHLIKVKDANSCTTSKPIRIFQPLKIFLVSKTDQTCAGNPNGTITVRADGGYKPYNFRLYKINGSTTSSSTYPYLSDTSFFSLMPNTYTIRVRDSLTTYDTVSAIIRPSTLNCSRNANVAKGSNENQTQINNSEEVYISPNPVNSFCNVIINDKISKACIYEIVDGTGIILKKGKATETSKLIIPVNDIQTGYYYLRLHIGNRVVCKKIFKN